jgi:FdhE protein
MDNGVQDLKRQHPEWAPWLAVIQEIHNEIADPKWEAMVPVAAKNPPTGKVPLLAAATVGLDKGLLHRTCDNLMRTAGRGGTPELASLQKVGRIDLDVVGLFRAVLNQEDHRLTEFASISGADPATFRAVAALLPLPFLQACNRRWKSSESWTEGYCPVCGAWPALAEVRGIERARYLRCAGCGSEWQAQCLCCPYCGMTDHNELESLMPEQSGSKPVIDACHRCLGYVKAFTRLQGSPPAAIFLEDLGTVELDLAAAELGYKRPRGAGYALGIGVA